MHQALLSHLFNFQTEFHELKYGFLKTLPLAKAALPWSQRQTLLKNFMQTNIINTGLLYKHYTVNHILYCCKESFVFGALEPNSFPLN